MRQCTQSPTASFLKTSKPSRAYTTHETALSPSKGWAVGLLGALIDPGTNKSHFFRRQRLAFVSGRHGDVFDQARNRDESVQEALVEPFVVRDRR